MSEVWQTVQWHLTMINEWWKTTVNQLFNSDQSKCIENIHQQNKTQMIKNWEMWSVPLAEWVSQVKVLRITEKNARCWNILCQVYGSLKVCR